MLSTVVCIFAVVAASQASYAPHGGVSHSSRNQDDYGNYNFKYEIADGLGATNGRWESGDGHGNKRGAYTLTDIDGRARRVEYVADDHGFRAVIKTNEPGTAASAPAAAVIASPYAGPVAQGVGAVHKTAAYAAAPVYAAPAYAAPVYAAPAYGYVAAKPAPFYGSYGSYAAPALTKGYY